MINQSTADAQEPVQVTEAVPGVECEDIAAEAQSLLPNITLRHQGERRRDPGPSIHEPAPCRDNQDQIVCHDEGMRIVCANR